MAGPLRIFGLMGQGGYLTSPAFAMFLQRLKPYGEVSTHSWSDKNVIPSIRSLLKSGFAAWRIAPIGYSLGGNALANISASVVGYDKLGLGIAYDPSQYGQGVVRNSKGVPYQVAQNFEKLLCYYNAGAGWGPGGSHYVGTNVTEIQVNQNHLGTSKPVLTTLKVQANSDLHAQSIKAIEALIAKHKGEV